MPVNGFPTTLEHLFDKIFEEPQLLAYKIAGNLIPLSSDLKLKWPTSQTSHQFFFT